jgi:CDP-diacylglycerol--glycerol-3-phosphate 3-phosphatidyltransferase
MKQPRITWKLNLPTILTLSRIVVIPFFIYITPINNFYGMVIFSLASITDFLDGYLARRSGEITTFGIIVDPIADKFLVIAALILLVDMNRVSVLVAVIIIVREFLITALRVVALTMDIIIPAERGGKWKTGFQITAIICLILAGPDVGYYPMEWLVEFLRSIWLDVYDVGTAALWLSIVLAIMSGYQYIINFWNQTVGAKSPGQGDSD